MIRIKIAYGFIFLFVLQLSFNNEIRAQRENCNFVYGKESSVTIFSGEVLKIRAKQIHGSKYMVKFKVDSVYKGEYSDKIYVYTSVNVNCMEDYHPCDFCGFEFGLGKKYLVYVCSESSGVFETNKCTFTREMLENEKDVIESDFGEFPDLGY